MVCDTSLLSLEQGRTHVPDALCLACLGLPASFIKKKKLWSFLAGWWVKDLALSLLWHRCDPQPGNFIMLQAQPPKTHKTTTKKRNVA